MVQDTLITRAQAEEPPSSTLPVPPPAPTPQARAPPQYDTAVGVAVLISLPLVHGEGILWCHIVSWQENGQPHCSCLCPAHCSCSYGPPAPLAPPPAPSRSRPPKRKSIDAERSSVSEGVSMKEHCVPQSKHNAAELLAFLTIRLLESISPHYN